MSENIIVLKRDGVPYHKKANGKLFAWPDSERGLKDAEVMLKSMASNPYTKRFEWTLGKFKEAK